MIKNDPQIKTVALPTKTIRPKFLSSRTIYPFIVLLFMACTSAKKISSPEINGQDRFLIITADDFGASKNINEGIELAADKNVLTTISALTNFTESFVDLKRISEKHPKIGIGVHLNVTTGKPILGAEQVPSLVNKSGDFYTINELLYKVKKMELEDLRKELRAQIMALKATNIRIDHLSDQHGILSLYRPFFDLITELSTEFNLPVRTPVIAGAKYPDLFTNPGLKKRRRQTVSRFMSLHPFKALGFLKYTRLDEMEEKEKKLQDLGIIHPDLTIISFWGDPTPANFSHIMEHLPRGISELILHVGTDTRQANYPRGLDLDYFKNRTLELNTVTSDSIQQYLHDLRIRTIGYSEIGDVRE